MKQQDLLTKQPLPLEEWLVHIRKWVHEGRWDLVKESARKRREYTT